MDEVIHICFAKVDFKCPHCGKEYSDHDDKYLDRLNNAKRAYITITCTCNIKFGMTYDMTGQSVGFKLK